MRKKALFAGAVAIMMTLCMPLSIAGDKSDMAGRIVTWEKQYNSGEFDALAAQYTEDATRMPYQAPAVQGREAIATMNRSYHEGGATSIDLELLGAESQGGMAWAHGTYHLKLADGSTFQTGKWINVSKKVGKQWLIQADIWNTDSP
jgi:ketosteroid isomerase-like protein